MTNTSNWASFAKETEEQKIAEIQGTDLIVTTRGLYRSGKLVNDRPWDCHAISGIGNPFLVYWHEKIRSLFERRVLVFCAHERGRARKLRSDRDFKWKLELEMGGKDHYFAYDNSYDSEGELVSMGNRLIDAYYVTSMVARWDASAIADKLDSAFQKCFEFYNPRAQREAAAAAGVKRANDVRLAEQARREESDAMYRLRNLKDI
jgi:hypothetical protein